MARDFNGTTDRIDYGPVDNGTGAQTLAYWTVVDNFPTGGNVRESLVMHRSGDLARAGLVIQKYFDGSGVVLAVMITSGTRRDAFTSGWSTGTLYHITITYNGGASAPSVYRNGTLLTPFTSGAGSGTNVAGDGTWSLGGFIFSDTRCYDGRLADVGWWNRVLSAREIAALAKGYSPRHFPQGLKFAPDLIRDARDPISGFAGTLDGTTVTRHPKIIYPAAPRVIVPTSSGIPRHFLHYAKMRVA